MQTTRLNIGEVTLEDSCGKLSYVIVFDSYSSRFRYCGFSAWLHWVISWKLTLSRSLPVSMSIHS